MQCSVNFFIRFFPKFAIVLDIKTKNQTQIPVNQSTQQEMENSSRHCIMLEPFYSILLVD